MYRTAARVPIARPSRKARTTPCSISTSTSASCATSTSRADADARRDRARRQPLAGSACRAACRHKTLYNAHVHRDYYEDMLGVTEMLVRHDRLPQQMVITIRDNLFTPVEAARTTSGCRACPITGPWPSDWRCRRTRHGRRCRWQRWREQISLPMLLGNAQRWYMAGKRRTRRASATTTSSTSCCRTARSSGRREHRRLFTPERARARTRSSSPSQPSISPPRSIRTASPRSTALLDFLNERGATRCSSRIRPSIPTSTCACRDTPYMEGLRRVDGADARASPRRYGLAHHRQLRSRQRSAARRTCTSTASTPIRVPGQILGRLRLPAAKSAPAQVVAGGPMPDLGSKGLRSTDMSAHVRPAHPAQMAMIEASRANMGQEMPPSGRSMPLRCWPAYRITAMPAHREQAAMIRRAQLSRSTNSWCPSRRRQGRRRTTARSAEDVAAPSQASTDAGADRASAPGGADLSG